MSGKTRSVFKEEPMLSVAQFARKLPCSIRHAYNLVDLGAANGGVLSYRLGTIKIPVAEVERYRNANRTENLKYESEENV